ncbi:unnamed protein product [Mucor hiemalis]
MYSGKERPSSLLSISSEDSISLEELINANYTADMDDETDLPALSSLDLDDSSDDFWKMDNFLNHLILPTHQFSPPASGKIKQPLTDINTSKYEESDDDFFHSKNTSLDSLEDSFYSTDKGSDHGFMNNLGYDNHNSKLLQVPTSLPASPKSITSSPIDRKQRFDRSGSISSENSFNSLSTITQNRQHTNVYPTASNSSSSIGSHSTTTTASSFKYPRSVLKPSSDNNKSVTRLTQSRFRQPNSVSETTSSTSPSPEKVRPSPTKSISHVGLLRRATHIPAPSSPSNQKKSLIPNTVSLNRTHSTTLLHKKSAGSLTRSASRIGQPNTRASHIPTPPVRSTTSLGISSIFSSTTSPPQQRYQQNKEERPKTSMGSLKSPSSLGLRRAPSTMIPSSSKSTSLRMPNSRTTYK